MKSLLCYKEKEMRENFFIEPITKDKVDSVTELYEILYNKKLGYNYLDKLTFPELESPLLGHIAFSEDGQPVGFVGMFPCKAKYKDVRIMTAQMGDVMTHPNHRRKGIFTLLANKNIELARNNNYKYLFGFPNDAAYPGWIKMGWENPCKILGFSKKLIPSVDYKIINRISSKLFYKIASKRIKKILLDDSGINFPSSADFHIIKDKSYQKYKSYSKTNYLLNLDNGVAWIGFYHFQIILGDFLIKDSSKADIFFNELFKFSGSLGASEIIYYQPSSYPIVSQAITDLFEKAPDIEFICYNLVEEKYENTLFVTGTDFDTF